jgi:hypothetical protein
MDPIKCEKLRDAIENTPSDDKEEEEESVSQKLEQILPRTHPAFWDIYERIQRALHQPLIEF